MLLKKDMETPLKCESCFITDQKRITPDYYKLNERGQKCKAVTFTEFVSSHYLEMNERKFNWPGCKYVESNYTPWLLY